MINLKWNGRGVKNMNFGILIGIVLAIAVIASVAAWINTQIIIKELTAIKEKLGIEKGGSKTSLFDNDLDSN